jgi:hypothetical protein
MESNDFDDLFGQAGEVVRALRGVYKDIVGEELDLESALKNYPIIAFGVVAGAGFLGGWWAARRRLPPALPPPTAESLPETAPGTPLEHLERMFPRQVGRVKDILPEGAADEAASIAKQWLDNVLEPKLRERLDTASASRFGAFLRESIGRFEQGEDTTLDEPEDVPPL